MLGSDIEGKMGCNHSVDGWKDWQQELIFNYYWVIPINKGKHSLLGGCSALPGGATWGLLTPPSVRAPSGGDGEAPSWACLVL